jgi:hypothetical protein
MLAHCDRVPFQLGGAAWVFVVALLASCVDGEPGPRDAGSHDAGRRDAGSRDAGRRDAGSRDAGRRDAGPRDAGIGCPPGDAGTEVPVDRDGGAALGEPCTDGCAAGLLCFEGHCREDCYATDPASPLGCPASERCVQLWVHFSGTPFGVCLSPCVPGACECEPPESCLPVRDVHGRWASHCFAPGAAAPGLDEPCFDRCAEGLVCAGWPEQGRCRRGCELDAEACPPDERCFLGFELPPDVTWIPPIGAFCASPCVPGGDPCPAGQWCVPHELDPATDTWIGWCR